MAVTKHNGDVIPFLKQKDYIMVNNDLGGGSFGKTVLLQDPFIDELFVAKKYEPECDEIKEQFYKNFLDEIKILYKLNHRNIVRIYNYYAYESIFSGYILMEYIDGKNIGEFIGDYWAPFATTTLDDVFIQLIDAFCYIQAHGIIHRDIREGNILIDKNGIVKVIDFGIGKIFTRSEENADSLASKINRAASDTLPKEYYDGVYTSLTDMFYLAEMFKRLIASAENCDTTDFSYNDILNKMMRNKPEDRYESFSEVREAIGKHDFMNMKISKEDREIYQNFTGLVYESISSYIKEPKFNADTADFTRRLEMAIMTNAFEDVIQKNSDVIGSVVSCTYRYNNRINIPCDTVRKFLDWFKASTPQSQALILNNFIAKISGIRVEIPEEDLPF